MATTTRFSTRYGFNPRKPREGIVEDAPEWMRKVYVDSILLRRTYVDRDARYKYEVQPPIGTKELYERFCRWMRCEEPSNRYQDSWYCNEELGALIASCEWYFFYDLVEMIGEELREVQKVFESAQGTPHRISEGWLKAFGFDAYRTDVNRLFKDEGIAWYLNEAGALTRALPDEIAQGVEASEKILEGRFAPAKQHYEKSRRYLFERPLDPENSIKEMVTALESIALVLTSSKSATLGDAVKALKKKQTAPERLLDVIERIYIFACAEPGVRHGKPAPPRVTLREADLVFHTGAALIRYLIEHVNDQGGDKDSREGDTPKQIGDVPGDEIPF